MISNATLEKWLIQIRRIEEHRVKGTERKVRSIYRKLYKELKAYIATEYEHIELGRYQLTARYGRFIEELVNKTRYYTPQIEDEIRELIEEVYEKVYKETGNALIRAGLGVKPANLSREIIIRAIENPVYGLTLSDILERHRREIIYDIKKNITIGLMNNDRYSTIAKRIKKVLEGDYTKSIRIVRTEAHRVQEAGNYDATKSVEEELKREKSAYKLVKKWQTMEDERVRASKKANHRKLNGQEVELEEYYNLGLGVKALMPGSSGDASNDINCRCMSLTNIVRR